MTFLQALKIGDVAYATSGSQTFGSRAPFVGKVTKITPSGQITIAGNCAGGALRAETRRFNTNGHQIGGYSTVVEQSTFQRLLDDYTQRQAKRELRDRLNQLGNLNLDNKEVVMQALREITAFAEINLRGEA